MNEGKGTDFRADFFSVEAEIAEGVLYVLRGEEAKTEGKYAEKPTLSRENKPHNKKMYSEAKRQKRRENMPKSRLFHERISRKNKKQTPLTVKSKGVCLAGGLCL